MSDLHHADQVADLLRQGKRAEAITRHNAHVRDELARAAAGAVINLSDLLAGKEALIVDDLDKRHRCLSCGRPTDNPHTCDDCERAAAERLAADPDPERCDACGALDPCDCRVYLT